MLEGIKNTAWFLVSIGAFLLVIFIGALILNGSLLIGETVLPWLVNISWIMFFLNLCLFLPLSFVRSTNAFGSTAMFFSSYIFGLTLWFAGLLFTYYIWGFLGVAIGLFLMGVGVVFTGMLATLLTGEFSGLLILVLLLIVTYGLKILSLYLSERFENKDNNDHLVHQRVYDVEYEEIDEE